MLLHLKMSITSILQGYHGDFIQLYFLFFMMLHKLSLLVLFNCIMDNHGNMKAVYN